jgi:hypothetical protein
MPVEVVNVAPWLMDRLAEAEALAEHGFTAAAIFGGLVLFLLATAVAALGLRR